MVEAGVDVFRLNFSHGSHEAHSAVLETIRRVAEETRTSDRRLARSVRPQNPLRRDRGGVVDCDHGAEFVLVTEPGDDNDSHCLTSTYRSAGR